MASKPIDETTESGHFIKADNNGYTIWKPHPQANKSKEGQDLAELEVDMELIHGVKEAAGSDSFTNIQRAKMWLENQK